MYRYEQIAADIESQIRSGEIPVRGALPSIERLAEEYGVARMTIVRAARELEARGLVVRLSGRGTFVRDSDDWGTPDGQDDGDE